MNQAFLETLGYIENELLSKPFMGFVHPDDLESTRALIGEKLLLGVNVLNFENRYRCSDGTYIWLSGSAHPSLERTRMELANDGAAAIEMVRQVKVSGAPYDAAIMDLTIPGGLGGKDAIGELLKIAPALKAIVCSGYLDDPVLANLEQYGFKRMLAKPFGSQSMGKVLHDVLRRDGTGDADA